MRFPPFRLADSIPLSVSVLVLLCRYQLIEVPVRVCSGKKHAHVIHDPKNKQHGRMELQTKQRGPSGWIQHGFGR